MNYLLLGTYCASLSFIYFVFSVKPRLGDWMWPLDDNHSWFAFKQNKEPISFISTFAQLVDEDTDWSFHYPLNINRYIR